MECNIFGCKKRAKHFFSLRNIRFGYCDSHTIIPDKIARNIKNGFYMGYRDRAK